MPVARAQSLHPGACDGAAQPALPHGTGDRCACDWRACLRVPPGRAIGGSRIDDVRVPTPPDAPLAPHSRGLASRRNAARCEKARQAGRRGARRC
nr:unknown [Insertion sequence IS407]